MILCFNYRYLKIFKYIKMMFYFFCYKLYMGIKIVCMDIIVKIWELKKSYFFLRYGQVQFLFIFFLWIKVKYIKYRYVKYKICVIQDIDFVEVYDC